MYHNSTFDNSKWTVYIFNTVFLIITATKYESQSQGCHQIYRYTQKKTSIWEHSCTNYQVQYGFILPVGSIFESVSKIIWWPSLKFNEWQKSVSCFRQIETFFKIIFDVFFSGSKKSLQNCNFRSFAFWLDNITILLSSGKSYLSCFALVKMLFWNILNFIWTSSLNCIFR